MLHNKGWKNIIHIFNFEMSKKVYAEPAEVIRSRRPTCPLSKFF